MREREWIFIAYEFTWIFDLQIFSGKWNLNYIFPEILLNRKSTQNKKIQWIRIFSPRNVWSMIGYKFSHLLEWGVENMFALVSELG